MYVAEYPSPKIKSFIHDPLRRCVGRSFGRTQSREPPPRCRRSRVDRRRLSVPTVSKYALLPMGYVRTASVGQLSGAITPASNLSLGIVARATAIRSL